MAPGQNTSHAAPLAPDPGSAGSLDDLVERLRQLKLWAGDPSFGWITDRVNRAWTVAGRPPAELVGRTTVVDCFRAGRRRLKADLVVAVVRALHPDLGYVTQWQQALRVVGGQSKAAAQVRVQGRLPHELDGFIGRDAALRRLCVLAEAVPVVISGMAGVGKTQLAIRAGHMLVEHRSFDRILYVNLRGFHADPQQPPADPAAVLDGFLRLLGTPGHQMPHDVSGRVAEYRRRLAGAPTLVVLDNAADEDQVRPLLPESPDCPVLITSRRRLDALPAAAHLTVDVFTAEEAEEYLTAAASHVPLGHDPDASTRIARRCGHLPLALGLVAGYMCGKPGWTLTDHADRLDERQHDRNLDAGVQLALDLSYRHLPADQRRLLRLAALHPGPDIDGYAAAALCDDELATARANLDRLCQDHLLHQIGPDRYTLHDLIRVYADGRARDDDRRAERRAALTRVFDYYLGTADAAMATLHPAEAHRRPDIAPAGTPAPALADPETACDWLDTERPALVAVAAHTAVHGWPGHAIRLSITLFRYLANTHLGDARIVQENARRAAELTGDTAGRALVLTNLGATYIRTSQYGQAAECLHQALDLYAQVGNPAGRARALLNLGLVDERQGCFRSAVGHYEQALLVHRAAGDTVGEARALGNLGIMETRLDRCASAAVHLRQALDLSRRAGDRAGEASHLNNLGDAEGRLGCAASAAAHLRQALTLYQQLGNRAGQASTQDTLGGQCLRLGEPDAAAEHFRAALALVREIGEPQGEACALNGLGEAANAAGYSVEAQAHHEAAHAIAVDIGDRHQQARAQAGLGDSQPGRDHARAHYRKALALYTELDLPHARDVRIRLDDSAHR